MNLPLLTLILAFFLISCNNSVKNEVSNSKDILLEIDTNNIELESKTKLDTIVIDDKYDCIVLGDINFDNIIDTAIVHTPAFYSIIDKKTQKPIDYFIGTVDSTYDNLITFSNGLPSLFIEQSLWGKVKMVDDINKDGLCEILVLKSWYNGCWNILYLYSLVNNQWEIINQSDINACGEDDFSKRIIKKGKKYYFVGTKTLEGDNFDDEIEIKMSNFK